MAGAVFVAHNVRFDFSFLKYEFKRFNSANTRMFAPSSYQKPSTQTYAVINCRILFDRCGIEVSASHRANDDDLEVWHFIQHIQQSFPAPLIEQAVKQQFKSPSLPKNFNSEIIKDSPDEPGVHVFQDSERRPLYIGKSLNIKSGF